MQRIERDSEDFSGGIHRHRHSSWNLCDGVGRLRDLVDGPLANPFMSIGQAMSLNPKFLAKLERKELIRIIMAQQKENRELRERTIDDYIRDMIRTYVQ
jgi:hypothetical protein